MDAIRIMKAEKWCTLYLFLKKAYHQQQIKTKIPLVGSTSASDRRDVLLLLSAISNFIDLTHPVLTNKK